MDGANCTLDLANVFMLSTEVRGQQREPGSAESREGVTWKKKNDCSQGGGEKKRKVSPRRLPRHMMYMLGEKCERGSE